MAIQDKFVTSMDDIQEHLSDMKLRIESLAKDYFGPHFYDEAKDYILTHPFIAIAIAFIGACSIIPVGIFLCFALATLIFSLICFICLEGSVIIIGGLILIGIISVITVIVVGFTASIAAAYWCAQKTHSLLCPHEHRARRSTNNLSLETRRNFSNRRTLQAAANPGHGDEEIDPSPEESSTSGNFEVVD